MHVLCMRCYQAQNLVPQYSFLNIFCVDSIARNMRHGCDDVRPPTPPPQVGVRLSSTPADYPWSFRRSPSHFNDNSRSASITSSVFAA